MPDNGSLEAFSFAEGDDGHNGYYFLCNYGCYICTWIRAITPTAQNHVSR